MSRLEKATQAEAERKIVARARRDPLWFFEHILGVTYLTPDQKALVEIEHYGFFDYVIVNDELERSKRALLGIALAERHRRVRMAPLAEALLRTGRI